ncbi:MAG: hypothetical protein JO307_06670 [Bryobacterales bacterium]|nr:hypothetical protein [Bryobacterales bacterium]MBV9398130.1 hypothetical protein [Bryobacterales bacterium]
MQTHPVRLAAVVSIIFGMLLAGSWVTGLAVKVALTVGMVAVYMIVWWDEKLRRPRRTKKSIIISALANAAALFFLLSDDHRKIGFLPACVSISIAASM